MSSCRPVRLVRIAPALAFALLGCVRLPRVAPLTGIPAVRDLPVTALPSGHRRVIFGWEYRERLFSARGSGVARIAPPDSARIDLFLENGSHGGYVILIADSIVASAQDEARRSLPSPPLLWAALGVVRVTGADTVVRLDADTLRAEVGRPDPWRVTFGSEAFVRLERTKRGRLVEAVERNDSMRVAYRQPGSGRSLALTIRQWILEAGFDAAIWRP